MRPTNAETAPAAPFPETQAAPRGGAPTGSAAGAQPCPPRIASIARAAHAAATVGIVLLALGAAAMLLLALFAPLEAGAILREELTEAQMAQAPGHGATILIFLIDQATTAVGLYALVMVRRLFAGYRRGEVFARAAAARLGRIGWAVLALAPVSTAAQTLAVLTATWANPPGERQFVIDIADSDVYAVVIGLALVAVARVMEEAARIAEENEGFV